MSSHTTFTALAAACAIGAAGCEATFTPIEPVVTIRAGAEVAPVAVVPADVWAYPRVSFAGGDVYLVNGLWYQPTPRGWVVFRREPVELARERTRIYATPGRGVLPRSPAYGYPPSRRPVPRRQPYEYGRERTPQTR